MKHFPRAIALVYLAAFASFYPQIPGLVGENGIEPYGSFFRLIRENYGARAYYLLPSLAWLHPTTGFLQLLAGLGIVLSILAAAAFGNRYVFAALWILWLSLVSAGGDFMSFQWDVLLLEAGFLTIFWVPTPPRVVVWLVRWLLFRLMLMSGAVKLLSRDDTWRNWTALNFHYQTQPLPNAIAWYMHQAPLWFGPYRLHSCGWWNSPCRSRFSRRVACGMLVVYSSLSFK